MGEHPDSLGITRGDGAWLSVLNDLLAALPADLLEYGALTGAVRDVLLIAMADIHHQVPGYADLDASCLLQTDLADTLLECTEDFVRAAPAMDQLTADVLAQRIRDLGFAEAHRGSSEQDLHHAAYFVARHGWHAISRYAADAGWPAATLGYLGTLLFSLRDQAEELSLVGHRSVTQAPGGSAEKKRQLIAALLADDSTPETRRRRELRERARAATWDVPESLVVLRFRPRRPGTSAIPPRTVIVDTTVSPARAITPSDLAERSIELLAAAGNAPIAVSPPATPAETSFADRVAKRAITLAESGVIESTPVIRCAEHATTLWLHAEPEIRARMAQDLLGPLLTEHPGSRMVLAETMLAWLGTRDSAPVIAARLGVHPQTVRYRWRRLHELFGDRLHDPEFIASASLLLRTTVPLWQHGDQADVDAFRPQGR